MKRILIAAAVVMAVLAICALFGLGVLAVAISNAAEGMRWNENDDREGR